MSTDLTYWEQHDDPSDPFPLEENFIGGAGWRRAVEAWDKRHENKAIPPAGPPPGSHVVTTGTSSSSSGGTYDLSEFTAGAISEAEQEANDFAGWLGWPKWFDYNAMVKAILQMGLQADANQAYQFLWTQLSKDQQTANQNAYFGLTKQQYTEKLNNLTDLLHMYTGQTTVPDALRNQALRENWTQAELLDHLEADPSVGATAPWLAAGMTFRDVASQFGQQYGTSTPKGPDVLASWWKFRTGAQAVAAGGPARQAFMPPQPLITRPLSSDVEVR